MYKVIKDFIDLQDNNHAYKVGDTFPREEAVVMSSRYEELATDKNRRKEPLIEEVDEPKKPRSKKTEIEE